MSDSTPQLEQLQTAQSQKEVTANQLFDAMSPASAYGRHAEACAGLVWGYYGTRFGTVGLIANGTSTLSASTTTYMVVNKSTGVVSFASDTVNWNDVASYARAYEIVTGADGVTSWQDCRFGPGGIQSASLVDVTAPPPSIPQNMQSADYTLVLADAGKHVFHPASDATTGTANPRTITIPSNSAVAFQVGDAVTFVNQHGAGTMSIAITTDTMRLAGAGTTGTRTLAVDGIATALKIAATEWIISGAGLS